MDAVLEAVAKVLELAANLASESISMFMLYQPKKPECMDEKSENQ